MPESFQIFFQYDKFINMIGASQEKKFKND